MGFHVNNTIRESFPSSNKILSIVLDSYRQGDTFAEVDST